MEDPLYSFLSKLNSSLKRKIKLVVIGGNALSLLGIKEYTDDIDIVISSSDRDVKQFCIDYKIKYGIPVHFFIDGLFKNLRIKDYFQKSQPIDTPEFENVEVKLLNVYDIILTKVNRYEKRDKEDLENILKKNPIDNFRLDRRFQQHLKFYMGPKDDFIKNYTEFKKKFGGIKKE